MLVRLRKDLIQDSPEFEEGKTYEVFGMSKYATAISVLLYTKDGWKWYLLDEFEGLIQND